MDILHTSPEIQGISNFLGHKYQFPVDLDIPLADIQGTNLDIGGIQGHHIFPEVVRVGIHLVDMLHTSQDILGHKFQVVDFQDKYRRGK